MADVMNFFQSFLMFNSLAPTSAKQYEVKLAIDLKGEAQPLAAITDKEITKNQQVKIKNNQ